MEELSRNIKEQGLIVPLLLRPKENGGYELISGHRRKRACELAGMQEVKAIVREMTDEEAIIQMVDSNRQREMKKLSEEGKLTESEIDRILKAEKPNQKEQIKFGVEKIQGYFPKGYTQEQMEKTIKDLLEKYKMQWQNKQKQLAR